MICCKNHVHISFHKKKKNVEWNCDNDITEIGGKKIVSIGLWQWHCRNI